MLCCYGSRSSYAMAVSLQQYMFIICQYMKVYMMSLFILPQFDNPEVSVLDGMGLGTEGPQ